MVNPLWLNTRSQPRAVSSTPPYRTRPASPLQMATAIVRWLHLLSFVISLCGTGRERRRLAGPRAHVGGKGPCPRTKLLPCLRKPAHEGVLRPTPLGRPAEVGGPGSPRARRPAGASRRGPSWRCDVAGVLLRARYLRPCPPRLSWPLSGAGPRFGPPGGPPGRGPGRPGWKARPPPGAGCRARICTGPSGLRSIR